MSLTKEERKQKLVEYAERYPIEDIPGINVILTEDNSFVRMSKGGVELSGFNNEDEMYGLHYHDLKCEGAKSHKIWEKDNNTSMKERRTVKVISLQNFATGWKILNGHQKPIIHKETNQVLGIISNFMDITEDSFLDIKKLIGFENGKLKRKQFQYEMYSDDKSYCGLTKREREVIFLRYHGYTYTEIANILSTERNPLKGSTVGSYMEKMRLKLNVKNNDELLEKCISVGMMGILSPSLFTYSD